MAELGDFVPIAAELGLDSAKSQKVLDTFLALDVARTERRDKAWVEALKVDKEYGGVGFEASLATAKRALAKYGNGQATLDALDETGAGNHPEMMRLLYRIGKAMAEDSVAGTAGNGVSAPSPEEAKQRAMFPTQFRGS